MPAQRERVLVTGGSGFLGANLVRALVRDKQEVHLVLRDQASRWRLVGLEAQFAVHRADLRDLRSLRRVVKACQPQVIYHLAMQGAFAAGLSRADVLKTNVIGLANLLDALDKVEYQRFVNVGTSAEYGCQAGPMREEDQPKPATVYAVSKAAATLLCQADAIRGKPVCTVRVFSAYGAWDHPGRLPLYTMRCCLGKSRPRITSAELPRDFIHVDDVIHALRIVATHPETPGQVLNVGSGAQQTVRDMVETVLQVCTDGRLKADYVHGIWPANEPRCYVADLKRIQQLTGWMPRTNLEAGLRKTWSWFCNHARSLAA